MPVFGQGIGEGLLATLIVELYRKNVWKARVVRCHLIGRNLDIRVAFSALLRIRRGDQYVLIRNLHMRDTFCPLGGVFKFHDSCSRSLDPLGFRPQDKGPGEDMRNDLRGFLPRKNLGKLVKWYLSVVDRETPAECLARELREEIREISLQRRFKSLGFSFSHVRSVWEGPESVPGKSYHQFRIFEVYDVVSDKAAKSFTTRLVKEAELHADLVAVGSEEILAGRSRSGMLLGHHSTYLLDDRRIRPGLPISL